MKFNLTEKALRHIFDIAHREWLEDSGHSRHKLSPERYLMARSYFKAVTSYLVSQGYTIELKHDEEQDKR